MMINPSKQLLEVTEINSEASSNGSRDVDAGRRAKKAAGKGNPRSTWPLINFVALAPPNPALPLKQSLLPQASKRRK